MRSQSQLHEFGTSSAMFDYATRVFEDRTFFNFNGRGITYDEMRREVAALAEALSSLNLRRGDGVAILASNSPETLFTREAANLRGLFYVTLNGGSPTPELIAIIEGFNVKAVLVDDLEYADKLLALQAALPKHIVVGFGSRDDGSGLSRLAEPFLGAPFRNDARPDDVVRVAQTGGTTGKPKGVMFRHRVQVSYLLMCNASWDMPQNMRFLSTTPLAHAAGTYAPLAMIRGGEFSVLPKFSPIAFQDAIRTTRSNCTMLVPTQMKRILQDPGVDPAIISGIETIAYGAAPISSDVLEAWLRKFGPNVSQLYGQTEAPMCITSLPKTLHSLKHPHRLASCGLPNIGVQVAILRTDGSEAGDDEIGEVVSRSPCVMEGYWERPEETAATLAGDWLHTGDLGYRDTDGFYYIVGRVKEMIISGGFNVYPKEIEDLLTSHPSVKDAAVIGVPDADWGEAVKAFVVLQPGADFDPAGITALVRERKGGVYAPKSIEQIDAIPLTPVGKPDKKSLRAPYWTGLSRSVA